jgi:hypothetical protein
MKWLCVAAAFALAGCGQFNSPLRQTNTGISSGGQSGLFISLSPSGTIFVDVGLSRQVTAVLTNDVGSKGVTWALSGPGTITNPTKTTVLYTAPSSDAPPATITATSVGDTTQVASATLFIGPLPTISTTTLPNGTVGNTYNAVINVAGGSSPFNWSLTSGTAPPGLGFSVSSIAGLTVSGAPTVAGSYTFTMQVLDVCNAVTSQSYTVVIAAGPEASMSSLLNGNYAFGFSGFGPDGLVAAAGSFTADGHGNITGGVQDRNSAAAPRTGLNFTGTYSIGANQLGTMTLSLADGTSATYAIAVTQAGNARFIEIDDTTGTGTRGSGEMKKRDAAALAAGKSAGSYAFQLTGLDVRSERMAMVGQFAVNDSSAVTQGLFDANDAGNVTSLAPVSGSYNVSAKGFGSAVLDVSGFGSVHLNLYAASPDDVFAVETDARNTGEPLLTGRILRQSGGPFTTTSLSGNAVLQMLGSGSNGHEGIIGVIQFSGTGDARVVALHAANTSTGNFDDASFLAPSSEGRAVFGSSGQFITYLVSPRQAFVVGTGPESFAGSFEAQDPGPFDVASFTGTLAGATIMSSVEVSSRGATSLSFDGIQRGTSVNVSFVNSSGLSTSTAPGNFLYSVTDGVVRLNSSDGGPDSLIGVFFLVSPKKAFYVRLGGEDIWAPQVIEK